MIGALLDLYLLNQICQRDKKRGENYILVYKIIGSDENIVQVEAGYQYNLDKDIVVKIDNTSFEFLFNRRFI